jgi:AcrR family transcriptional regulator
LVAARALFAAQGVDATSMTEIARAAKLGQGTLYRRFAHKGELCEALLKENILCFQEAMEARFAGDENATSLDRLSLLFAEMMLFNERNYPLLVAISDSANGARRSEFFHNPYYRWLHATIVQLLEQGIAAGEIRELEVELTAHLMISAFKGRLYCYQRHELGYTPDQILVSVRDLLIEGLRSHKQAPVGD